MGYKKDRNAPLVSDKAIRMEWSPCSEFGPAMRAIDKYEKQMFGDEFRQERETAELIEDFIAVLDRLGEEKLDPILIRPDAEPLRAAIRQRRRAFGHVEIRAAELFEPIKRILRRSKHHGLCPYCHGVKCGECKGKGKVTVGEYLAMKDSMR